MAGETTVRHSHRTFSNTGATMSEPEVARPLMTPDEVRRMRTEHEVLIFTRRSAADPGDQASLLQGTALY